MSYTNKCYKDDLDKTLSYLQTRMLVLESMDWISNPYTNNYYSININVYPLPSPNDSMQNKSRRLFSVLLKKKYEISFLSLEKTLEKENRYGHKRFYIEEKLQIHMPLGSEFFSMINNKEFNNNV